MCCLASGPRFEMVSYYRPKTVSKAINEDKTPDGKRQSRRSILDPYKDYIKQRLDKYDLTGARLLKEIGERGYTGSYTIVKDYVRQVKGAKPLAHRNTRL